MRTRWWAIPAALAALSVAVPAHARFDKPEIPWTGTNPYVFALGDSVMRDCGEKFGMDWRSLGYIAWPGATTEQMRGRLESDAEGFPFTTESSNAEERLWFRDAGSLVIHLGTIDVKTDITPDEFRDQVDWFMGQARGRPVEWLNIHNPPFQRRAEEFNYQLWLASFDWPNLKVVDWDAWAGANPDRLLDDRVHVQTFQRGCVEGHSRLIQFAAPDEPGRLAPQGYWYPDSRTTGPVFLNGWGAGNHKTDIIEVNVRSDYVHVTRVPVDGWTGDPWALAASGRGFGVALPASHRGHLISVDLVDSAGRFTSLGERRV